MTARDDQLRKGVEDIILAFNGFKIDLPVAVDRIMGLILAERGQHA